MAGGGSLSARESPLRDLLRRSKSIILEGVPGTGKTYAIKNDICNLWEGAGQKRELGGEGDGHYAITLHPATSYEDFVEGLRPVSARDGAPTKRPGPRDATGELPAVAVLYGHDSSGPTAISGEKLEEHGFFHVKLRTLSADESNKPTFTVQDGFFLRVCAEAVNNPKKDYVVLLDEFNRCNVPKVMGDLLTTMERSKRAKWDERKSAWDLDPCQVVTLPASKRLFFVPENVYVVATMNSTDRSVAPLDSALRRRFAFHRCWPLGFGPEDEGKGKEACVFGAKTDLDAKHPSRGAFEQSVEAWVKINTLLLKEGGPDALLGHSYLMDLATDLKRESNTPKAALAVWVQHHWNHHILPQLADVLVTHSLDSRLVRPVSQDGKEGKEGNILTLKVGDRPIIQPPGMASSERGSHGTLVLQLKPPHQDENAAVGSTQPTGAYVPQLLQDEGPGKDLCGVWFLTAGGGNVAARAAAVDLFWNQLREPGAPKPHSVRYAKDGKFSSVVIADVPEGVLDVDDIKKSVADKAKNYGKAGAAHALPWACYFKSENLEWVQALVEKLGKPATSK